MLHEDNEEIRRYFQADEEIVVFAGSAELLARIQDLLKNDRQRERIQQAGQRRCLAAPYTYDSSG